jgi:DNA-binding beta-propeller fold protein YncE
VPLPDERRAGHTPLFVADGSRVVLVCGATVGVFDSADGRLVKRVGVRTSGLNEIGKVGLTPDGRTLHVVNERRVLTLIDTADWTVRHRIHPLPPAPIDTPLRVDFSPDGTRAFVLAGASVRVVDLARGGGSAFPAA